VIVAAQICSSFWVPLKAMRPYDSRVPAMDVESIRISFPQEPKVRRDLSPHDPESAGTPSPQGSIARRATLSPWACDLRETKSVSTHRTRGRMAHRRSSPHGNIVPADVW